MTKSYRLPQIEYLRAVAVVAVILNHLNALPAGFMGVDVFFVISGFVISQALHESVHTSILSSLKHFYYRRIIRILPPLIVVTVGSFIFGWFLFFDEDFGRLQQAISHQSLFLQNVYFVETVNDYFRGIPSTELTLHTWSLAVEEQFYLIYPLLFIGLFRAAPVRRSVSIASMALMTAVATYFAMFDDGGYLHVGTVTVLRQFLTGGMDAGPVRFYSISFRAWEFLLGWGAFALKARLTRNGESQDEGVTWRRVVFFVGLALLCAMTFRNVDAARWPTTYTVVGCLVTACCLAATDSRAGSGRRRNPFSRLMMYVGNTSYSAYLWHWPVLGYFLYTNVDFGATAGDYLLFFAVLSVLVMATYHTVEKHRFRISPAYSLVLLIGFVAGMHVLGMVTRDYTWFGPVKQNIFATARYDQSECGHRDVATVTRRFVVLFGESHAQAVRAEFQKTANGYGFDVLCINGNRARLSSARDEAEKDLARAVSAKGYSGSFLVMRWNSYAFGYPAYEVEERGNRYLSLNGVRPRNALEAESFFKLNLGHLLRSIPAAPTPRDIGILLQVPQHPFSPEKESLIDFHRLRFRPLAPKPAAQYVEETARMRNVLAEVTTGLERVSILDPGPFLCHGTTCEYRHEWNVLYKDDDHLSVYGESLLGPLFRRWFETVAEGSAR